MPSAECHTLVCQPTQRGSNGGVGSGCSLPPTCIVAWTLFIAPDSRSYHSTLSIREIFIRHVLFRYFHEFYHFHTETQSCAFQCPLVELILLRNTCVVYNDADGAGFVYNIFVPFMLRNGRIKDRFRVTFSHGRQIANVKLKLYYVIFIHSFVSNPIFLGILYRAVENVRSQPMINEMKQAEGERSSCSSQPSTRNSPICPNFKLPFQF